MYAGSHLPVTEERDLAVLARRGGRSALVHCARCTHRPYPKAGRRLQTEAECASTRTSWEAATEVVQETWLV